jgi:hypothetical protein
MDGSVPPVLQKTVNDCVRGVRGKDVAVNNMKEDGISVCDNSGR